MRDRLLTAMVGVLLVCASPATLWAGGGGGGTDIKRDTVAAVRDVSGSLIFFTRSSNDGACTTPVVGIVGIGAAGDTPLAVDLDGDGLDQPAVFRNQMSGVFGTFYVTDEDSPTGPPVRIDFGAGTDIPIVGNLDPTDPGDEVGVYRQSNNTFYLNTDSGLVEIVFGDNTQQDVPIVGNWDASMDGSEEIGLYRPTNNQFYMRSDNSPGADVVMQSELGTSGDIGFVGDFDGDGRGTTGVLRDFMAPIGNVNFLNNSQMGSNVDEIVLWGDSGDITVLGDWDGTAVDNAGCSI